MGETESGERTAVCVFCGECEEVTTATAAGDFIVCPHCGYVGVWNGRAMLEMSPVDRADFFAAYPGVGRSVVSSVLSLN